MTHIGTIVMVQLLIQYYSVGISKQPDWSPLMKVMPSSLYMYKKRRERGRGRGRRYGAECVCQYGHALPVILLTERENSLLTSC